MLIQRIIETAKVVKSQNKPRFVTVILAIEYGFTVYFFCWGVLDMRTGRFEGPFLANSYLVLIYGLFVVV